MGYHGHPRVSGAHGSFVSVGAHGSLLCLSWPPMGAHASLVGSSGLGSPVGSRGLLWASMGSHGSSWTSMGSHGCPWISVGYHGRPWMTRGRRWVSRGIKASSVCVKRFLVVFGGLSWAPMSFPWDSREFLQTSMDFPWSFMGPLRALMGFHMRPRASGGLP